MPQNAIDSCHEDPSYRVYISNVKLGRMRKSCAANKVIVFQVHKVPNIKYMLPEAHFYGPFTYGTIWYKNRPLIAADVLHNRIFHHVTLQLCTPHGQQLPMISSTHDYLSSKRFVFNVNLHTFQNAHDTCCVTLDRDRLDVNNLPSPSKRIYTLMPANLHPNDGADHKIMVLEKKRNLEYNGHVIKYALVALIWQPSYIQTALSRDVGTFTKSEFIDTPERALPGVGSILYKARSQAKVKVNEDFWYNDAAVRITRIEENKFYFKKLILT